MLPCSFSGEVLCWHMAESVVSQCGLWKNCSDWKCWKLRTHDNAPSFFLFPLHIFDWKHTNTHLPSPNFQGTCGDIIISFLQTAAGWTDCGGCCLGVSFGLCADTSPHWYHQCSVDGEPLMIWGILIIRCRVVEEPFVCLGFFFACLFLLSWTISTTLILAQHHYGDPRLVCWSWTITIVLIPDCVSHIHIFIWPFKLSMTVTKNKFCNFTNWLLIRNELITTELTLHEKWISSI